MTTKRIYILNGHPAESSLNRTLAETYAAAARDVGHEVRLTHLHGLAFDLDFGFGGYDNQKPLEPDLEQVLADIEWSEHVVLTTPMWWGGLPAKLKGLSTAPSCRAGPSTRARLIGWACRHPCCPGAQAE